MWHIFHRINQSTHLSFWFSYISWGSSRESLFLFFLSRVSLSMYTFLGVLLLPECWAQTGRSPLLLPSPQDIATGLIERLLDQTWMSQETWNLTLTLPLISSEALGNDFFSLSINFLIYIVKNELYPLQGSSWIQILVLFQRILRRKGESFTLLFILSVISLIIYWFHSSHTQICRGIHF